MGNILSVWSPSKKTGKTTFIYTLSNVLARLLSEDTSILVGCVNLNYGNVLKMFDISEKEFNFEELVNFKMNSNEEINYKKILGKRGDLYFVGSTKTNMEFVRRHMIHFEKVLNQLKDAFDVLIIDTLSGYENALTAMVLDKSDYVINMVVQDVESFKENIISDKDNICVINRFRDIYPREKDLEAILKVNKIFIVPESNELQEYKNREKLGNFLQHEEEPYIGAVNEIAWEIIRRFELKSKNDAVVIQKKKGLFSFMK
jgi:MinD-like ATPase involved in chromosome partitioning or flagellar assembly